MSMSVKAICIKAFCHIAAAILKKMSTPYIIISKLAKYWISEHYKHHTFCIQVHNNKNKT